DIDRTLFSHNDVVGITAGASTPDWIIKEVLNKMNDINDELMEEQEQQQEAISQDKVLDIITDTPADEELTMDNFKIVSLKPGQIVKGTILRVDINELIVNVGYKSDGIVPNDEIILDSDQKLHDVFKEGDEIEVEVLMINDGDGNVLLSQKTIAKKLIWKEIEEIFKNQTEVAGIGMEIVKGGLIARVKGISAFVPASQLTTRYVEDLSTFVGQNLRLKILEIDKARSRIVASQKIVLEAADTERRQQVWENIQEGQKINGEVKRLTNFGAFVDIGGVDGLIHISDLAWGHINNPRQVVTEGQQIEVIVLSLDRDKNKIALGYKQTKPRPWDNIEEKYPVGQITKGKVVRIANFGAFVELEPGVDGLVHISEISDKRINKVEDVLKSGDIVSVKILDVKYKEQRISLSIREASVKEDTTMPQQEENTLEHEDMNVTLGEFFPDKLKDIE
ncbi:MAG: 30S ribosomal protein S1, partial [Firmicutes bacterium]|nr:30S ribosomal protein S1 [Bacillota bacterium]